jgi:methyl-accepting chemotaxis protein
LALIAAIEAARPGEAGKGFAVVAEELNASGKEIMQIISTIQKDNTLAVDVAENGTKYVQVGMDVVKEANASFNLFSLLII